MAAPLNPDAGLHQLQVYGLPRVLLAEAKHADLIDCRTCAEYVARGCACPRECDLGFEYRALAPIRLWRGA